MLPRIQRTPAEASLLQIVEAAAGRLPGDAAVSEAREAAGNILRAGLPTRRIEAWHYTDLRRLLTTVPDGVAAARSQPTAPVLPGSWVLSVLDGAAVAGLAPEGATAVP